MAYIFSSAVDLRHNLKYEFVGGDVSLAIDALFHDGHVLRGYRLRDCLGYCIPIPDVLMKAVPRRIVVTPCKDGFVPDFGYAADYGCYVVSNRFVEILERLEPGVHQFLEIPECVTKSGQPLAFRFFLLNIRTRLSAIDVEKSFVHWLPSGADWNYLQFKPGPGNLHKLVLKKSVIEGHHLWNGSREQFATYTFCSEVLRVAMSGAGLSEMRLRWCDES